MKETNIFYCDECGSPYQLDKNGVSHHIYDDGILNYDADSDHSAYGEHEVHMKKYEVTIKAVITKTISMDAENEEEAIQQAHEVFSVLNDGVDENYEQDTVDCEEVKNVN